MTRESELIAKLKSHQGTEVLALWLELLEEKLDKYKSRLVQSEDQNVRGRAQECIDLLKHFRNDLN
jgi:hypothetical protein